MTQKARAPSSSPADQRETSHAAQRCLLSPQTVAFSIGEDEIQLSESGGSSFAVIGQDRAMLAIEMALSIRAKGYNLFVSGPAGTGKRTAVTLALSNLQADDSRKQDIALVHDFEDPDAPRPLYFPAGKAHVFRSELRSFLLNLAATIGELSSHPQFQKMRDQLILQSESEEQQLIFDFEGRVHKEGFKIVQIEEDDRQAADILPLINDEISDFDELQQLVAKGEMNEDTYTRLREQQLRFIDEMKALFVRLQRRRAETQERLERLRLEILHPLITEALQAIKLKYNYPDVDLFLNGVEHHLVSKSSFIHSLGERELNPSDDEGAKGSAVSTAVAGGASNPPAPAPAAGRPGTTPAGLVQHYGGTSLLSPVQTPSTQSAANQSTQANATQTAGTQTASSPTSPAQATTASSQSLSAVASSTTVSTLTGSTRPGQDLPEFLRIYDLNILVDQRSQQGCPVINEQYPDYTKLFGSIENPPEQAPDSMPGHLLVRAGSLLKATGGYLIMQAEDLLREEEVYITMKRALLEQAMEIRNPSSQMGNVVHGIKPKPIRVDAKLIVMAPDGLYEALYDRDEDFQKLFKVLAEFDMSVDRTPAITQAFADFFLMNCREEGLLPPDKSAVSALLEYAVRISEFRNKLCTRFSLLADIMREADYWARRSKVEELKRQHVEKALQAREFLYNLPEEKIDEQILLGELLLQVQGSAVGRVNGLAVMDRGFYSFGRPTVISAQVAPGTDGVVNVEREVGLSGEIHDKGTFIVASWLQATFTNDFPLAINAHICFEQSYSEIDGDSASSTEVYALLSAIAQVPLRQDIAVTGSVNQMGFIQPVGGVIEKIEGFYWVCNKVGLTGTQGVIIPHQNINNLILSDTVEEAIRQGKFHVWAIRTIDEGIEILTGLHAGQREVKGNFPQDSLYDRIEKRLRQLAQVSKDFSS